MVYAARRRGKGRPRVGRDGPLAHDWKSGFVRLGVVLAASAAVVLGAWLMVRPLGTVSIYLTGYVLLIGGFLALGALYAAVGWIERGFRGNGPPTSATPSSSGGPGG